MKLIHKTFLALLLTSTLCVYSREPKKLSYIMGGGGEPQGNSTIFDGDLSLVGNFVEKSDWDHTVSFNGGHSKTENIVKSKMGKARDLGSFTEENYNKMLDEMIEKIQSGELVKGDQLMVMINTHGGENNGRDLTHQISLAGRAAGNLRTLGGARTVSLDRMEKLAKLAADKDVKLAIINNSCFSGNLLNIKNDKVCLISGAGSKEFGYAGTLDVGLFSMAFTFSGRFLDQFKKGKNLEEMFLKARETTAHTPDYPMISTPEGQIVDKELYELLHPFMRYNDKNTRVFSEGYSLDEKKFNQQVCNNDHSLAILSSFLKDYEKVNLVTDEIYKDEFAELRKALEVYRDQQKEYEEVIRDAIGTKNEIVSILLKNFPREMDKLLATYDPIDLAVMDLSPLLKAYESFSDDFWKRTIADTKKTMGIIDFVKANLSPDGKKKLEAYEKTLLKSKMMYNSANRVATQAKKVYASLYQFAKKPQSNPCRDFVL